MESTPGKRLQQWREFKGISLTEMFRTTGVKVTTLSTAESPGASNPSYDTITKVLAAYPDLNPDWLLLGTGPMLRAGRALAAANMESEMAKIANRMKPVAEPSADYTSGEATTATLYIEVLKEQVADLKTQVADLKVDKADLKAEVSELRGKPFDSSDAAGPTTYPTDPTDPRFAGGVAPAPMIRKRAGFAPSYVEAAELS